MEYTTLDALKAFLKIEDNAQDEYLEQVITSASRVLATELWDDLSLKTQTRRYDAYGTAKIVLEQVVNSVSLVEHTTDNGYSWSPVAVDFVDWYIVYLRQTIPSWYKCLRVTYSKWYATVPADLEQFFLKYVNKIITDQLANSDSKEIKTKKLDGLSITYFGPDELASRDRTLWVDYDTIKNKYKVFSFAVPV